ncbi:hypothetical protein [Aquipuribacter sp. MA13-6]|uniref:hypothetical protein n=1 Tax=unclassified Aquipuribacter TaxID=2635084 RepID=UPI003EE8E2E2
MPRSSRAAVGGVVVLVLLLVAAVSGLVAAVAAAQVRGGGPSASEAQPAEEWFTDPVTVEAEVLDVDGDRAGGWASVDVAFDTEVGRKVSVVDLGEQDGSSPPLPEVGDTVTVVHERSDPSYVLRADDPVLTGEVVDDVPGVTAEEARATGQALVGRTRALALGSLALAVVVAVVTVVAVRRAPPARGWAEPPPPGTAEARTPADTPGR